MDDVSPCSVVLKFIDCVNDRNLDALNSLISEKVVFIDIRGRVYREPGFMEGYLKEFPDYKIHVQHALEGGSGVAIIGQTSGSHVSPEIEANGVLVWTAEIESGLITEWRIYSSHEYATQS